MCFVCDLINRYAVQGEWLWRPMMTQCPAAPCGKPPRLQNGASLKAAKNSQVLRRLCSLELATGILQRKGYKGAF